VQKEQEEKATGQENVDEIGHTEVHKKVINGRREKSQGKYTKKQVGWVRCGGGWGLISETKKTTEGK